MPHSRIAVLIPTFNNATTIEPLIDSIKPFVSDIIIVNDGSTDTTAALLAPRTDCTVLTLPHNSGKGAALQHGFAHALHHGFTHVITMDADGQHLAADLPAFINNIEQHPNTLWIGNRTIITSATPQPSASRFGAQFGAFWYRFNTGLTINDTQCGFRAYPLAALTPLNCRGSGYEYELQLLTQAAWSGTTVSQFAIHLLYQPPEERVSHFRPLRDFARIGLVNARAAITRIFMPWRFLDAPGASVREKITLLFKRELALNHNPAAAAFALALGVCIGLMPIHGFQVLLVLALTMTLRLNKALALLGCTISSPPLLPFWLALQYAVGCILLPASTLESALGALAHSPAAPLLARLTATERASSVTIRITQWALGSVVVAVVLATIVWLLAWVLLSRYSAFKERRTQRCDHAL